MVSIIKVTSIQDTSGNNETTTANIKKSYEGASKAWVNFNGTGTVAIRDSLNASSITDNGTGDYTVNFSNAFGVAENYATSGCVRRNTTGSTAACVTTEKSEARSSSSCRFELRYPSTLAVLDVNFSSTLFLGDLA